MPRCCLNFQSMRTQAESTYIAHYMFGQIKMEIPWYINRHTLISRKRDGKPEMIGGQFVVVCVGVHQGVTRMAYSPSLWLMAIGWWNKINQCRKLKLNLTQNELLDWQQQVQLRCVFGWPPLNPHNVIINWFWWCGFSISALLSMTLLNSTHVALLFLNNVRKPPRWSEQPFW